MSAQLLPKQAIQIEIERIQDEVKGWKDEIPESFRPGCPVRVHHLSQPAALSVAIRTHFCYYHLRIALLRRSLYVWSQDGAKQMEFKVALAEAARCIIDLTHFIPLEPFSIPWYVNQTSGPRRFFVKLHTTDLEAHPGLYSMFLIRRCSFFSTLSWIIPDIPTRA